MYGLIGRITAVDGARQRLAAILLDGIGGMPGCYQYVVAADANDHNVLWVTEIWDSSDSHVASLRLPSVQKAISAGRPLIAGMEQAAVTEPLGGIGFGDESDR